MPIDAAFALGGPEWQIEGLSGAEQVSPAAPAEGNNVFAGLLEGLQGGQTEAAEASQALATGTAADPEAAVMALERARLSMQLAAQLRDRAVESTMEIFRTQV
jgi:flagellar hook-basal body complex protein FliE